MRLDCPWCGPRPVDEFVHGGDAGKRRPMAPDGQAGADEARAQRRAWLDYVYRRNNPAGRIAEFWHHSGGCGCWLVVERDTVSHEIARVRLADPEADRAVQARDPGRNEP